MSSEVVDDIQVSRIPILKPDEYNMWRNRIKQHMLLTDYQMWDIVENGPKFKTDANGVRLPRTPPTTDAERRERATELKALSTLLLSIPNEYQWEFDQCEDAKILIEALDKRFGGNESTKKHKRSLLKQQFENFSSVKSETLTQTFDRFSKLVGDLENHKVKIDRDDLNRKFLRSLGDEWTIYTVGLRQKSDLDDMEIVDLYNGLKAFEPEVESRKQATGYSQNVQNAAFVSMGRMQADSKPHGSSSIATGSGSGSSSQDRSNDQVMEAFFASHVNSSLTNEELEQVNPDDLEEMDIKWQMAMITMRVKRYLQRTGRNNFALKREDNAGFDKSKVECYNCHKLGHFARECRSARQEDRNGSGSYAEGFGQRTGGYHSVQRRNVPIQETT